MFKYLYVILLLNFLSLTSAISQTKTEDTNEFNRIDSINVDSMEICFGYKILRSHFFYVNRSGIYQRNHSVLSFESDEQGQINIELICNNNNSLDIEDFKECVLPYIKLSTTKYKTRNGTSRLKKLSIIFDEGINKDNEYQDYISSLGKTRAGSINYYKEERKLEANDYDENISRFNKLKISEDVESIFTRLDSFSNLIKLEYLNGYKNCESRKERTIFSNRTNKEFRVKIHEIFLSLLKDYFD